MLSLSDTRASGLPRQEPLRDSQLRPETLRSKHGPQALSGSSSVIFKETDAGDQISRCAHSKKPRTVEFYVASRLPKAGEAQW